MAFLRIPFENTAARNQAKAAGAKWQAAAKLWKLDGDCPEALAQFVIVVKAATDSLDTIAATKLNPCLELLKVMFRHAQLSPNSQPNNEILELVKSSSITPGATIGSPESVQALARMLAARLLYHTDQRDLARSVSEIV